MPQRRTYERETVKILFRSSFLGKSSVQGRSLCDIPRDNVTHFSMLASIRRISRSLPSSFRALSTAGSKTTALLKSALDGVDAQSAPRSALTPKPTIPTSDIPPAEDPLLHYVTSNIMQNGRRAKASRITSKTLLYIHTLTREPPMPIFRKAIELASPAVRMVNNRSGAKVIPTPLPLSEKQRTRYAVHWILKASNGKPGRSLEERLAREIIGVIKGQSSALEEKLRVHRSAMINRYVCLLYRPAGLKLMIAEGISEPLISLFRLV